MQFDETDLISTQSARQVPPQSPVQSVAEILQNILRKDALPKKILGGHGTTRSLREKSFSNNGRKRKNCILGFKDIVP